MLNPEASDAAELETEIGQNDQSLGKNTSVDLEKTESDGLASSCI